MEVDILIDRITNCLIDTRTGEEVEAEYRMRETPIKAKDTRGGNLTGVSLRKTGMIDGCTLMKRQHGYCWTDI